MSEANGEYPPLSCSPCPFCGNDDLGIGRGSTEDRRDCKNLSPDGKRQCLCNPDWPELTEAIRRHNVKVRVSE